MRLNREHIQLTGGLYQGVDNLLNPGSLEWVLDAIQHPLFGIDRYPTLVDKVSILTWTVIAYHVFHDGNKRTGISVMGVCLQANGFDVVASYDDLMHIALCLAGGLETKEICSPEEFVLWIRHRLTLYVEQTSPGPVP